MDAEPAWLIETPDYEGTPIVLAQATWHTKVTAHPEISDYLADVKNAIQQPHFVFQSTRDERARVFYRLSVGRGQWQGKHLVLVVKYLLENDKRRGYISTIYLSRAVYSRGELLWKSTELILPSE